MTKKLTQKEVDKIISDLQNVPADCEAAGFDFNDLVAFEIARNTFFINSGLKEYVVSEVGATDYVGWLANQF